MTDIAKCKGGDCPLKETCYRYIAPADEYAQSYFVDPPYDKEKEECEYYWEND